MTTVVVNGFFVGLVYGLLAAGLVVVYRGSRIINFAYGETGMTYGGMAQRSQPAAFQPVSVRISKVAGTRPSDPRNRSW